MTRSVEQAFRGHLRDALATAMRTPKQSEPYVSTLRRFVAANGDEDALDAMLEIYFAESEKLEEQNGRDAIYLSASIFEHLVELRIKVALFYDPWLQEALKLLQVPQPAAEPDDPFRKRFSTLDSVNASKIQANLRAKLKAKKESLTFFEILIDLYALKLGAPPGQDHQLLSFAPANDAALQKDYNVMVGQVLMKVFGKDAKGTEKALLEFARWANRTNDMARSFQILLWSRDTALRVRGRPHALESWVFNEIYLVSIQRALLCAINSGYHKVQTGFLSEEEIDVLIEPLMPSRYFSDYADRLYPLSTNGAFAGGNNFTDLSALHLRLVMFADSKDIHLLSAQERDGIADLLLQSDPSVKKRTVWVSGKLAAAARTVTVGNRIGDAGTIAYVESSDALIVCLDGFEHQLFHVHKSTAGDWLDQYIIDELRRGTEHLLILIPALFEVLQYTHVFITGGFTALIEEFIEDQIAELAGDLVYQYTGNEKLQMAVDALGNYSTIAVPGRIIAKGAGKAGAKAVRSAKAAWKARKSTIPRAKALKTKKPPKAKKPTKPKKSKQPKPRTKAEQAQILKAETELRALKAKKVKLGKRDPNGNYDELAGTDAVALLFRDKIGDIPRLAQHWPADLQKKYLKEIRDAVEKGLKKNPALQKQALASIDGGVLNKALLDALPPKLQKQVRGIVVDRWNQIRTAFWKRVRSDVALRKELEAIGIRFRRGSRPGSAPDLHLGGIKMKCSLDHVMRKVENPLEAFSAGNLRILTGRDNSVLKEGIVRIIKQTTELDLDEFAAAAKWGRDPIPQSYKDGLTEALQDAQEEQDLLRSFDDPSPPPKPSP